MRELHEVSAPTRTSGFFQISASIDNVKHIFYRDENGSRHAENSPYTMNTFSLDGASVSTCRLEYGNGIFYPETEYDSESKVRIFNDTGTHLNLANYNSLFPLIYFNLTYQTKNNKRSQTADI